MFGATSAAWSLNPLDHDQPAGEPVALRAECGGDATQHQLALLSASRPWEDAAASVDQILPHRTRSESGHQVAGAGRVSAALNKSCMDTRTRERLPVLPVLVRGVDQRRKHATALLEAARATPSGQQFIAAGGS